MRRAVILLRMPDWGNCTTILHGKGAFLLWPPDSFNQQSRASSCEAATFLEFNLFWLFLCNAWGVWLCTQNISSFCKHSSSAERCLFGAHLRFWDISKLCRRAKARSDWGVGQSHMKYETTSCAGVFPKTLRNMWVAVSFINIILPSLAVATSSAWLDRLQTSSLILAEAVLPLDDLTGLTPRVIFTIRQVKIVREVWWTTWDQGEKSAYALAFLAERAQIPNHFGAPSRCWTSAVLWGCRPIS